MYAAHVMAGEFSPTDPKPRLRWTAELHERFVDAVNQLGGADSEFNLLPSLTNSQVCGNSIYQASVGPLLVFI